MNKKYIIGAVVIALAIWIGFSWGKKSAQAPEAPVNNVVEQAATTSTSAVAKKTTTTTVAPKTTTTAPKTSVAPTLTKDGSYLVSYTGSGFSPRTITIKAGKSVHFVNNSSKAMSLTTTDVDNQAHLEFNQGKTVGQGGVYDFTFMSAGTWGYMNRNNQADRGTIIVQ